MDWTKIKVKHFLFNDMSKKMKGDLVDLLCLTAHLERMPTQREMLKVCHHKALLALQERFKECSRDAQETFKECSRDAQETFKERSRSLQDVLMKVLEDVQDVQRKRNVSRETSRRYNEKKKSTKVDSDVSNDVTEKRREDNIRLNNPPISPQGGTVDRGGSSGKKPKPVVYGEHFLFLWNLYPRQDGKKEAWTRYQTSVLNEEDKARIERALKNYLMYTKTLDSPKYIKLGKTWFNNWEDWVSYKPSETPLELMLEGKITRDEYASLTNET